MGLFTPSTPEPQAARTRPAETTTSSETSPVPPAPPAPAAATATAAAPDWIIAELPPAHAEIARKIEALRRDAKQYEEIAGVLWQAGPPLAGGVRDIFTALKFDATLAEHEGGHTVRVDLGGDRRLVVEVVGSSGAIDRKSPAITEILRLLQADLTERDRLVLAVNAWCTLPLDARRNDAVTPDALKLVQRVGANVVATSTLFGIWKYSLTDLEEARKSVIRLYSHDGGFFK